MPWLYEILSNGTLVDNQVYTAREHQLYNHRFSAPKWLEEDRRRSKYPKNWEVWQFLNRSALQVNQCLAEASGDTLVLFNDKHYEHNTEDPFFIIAGSYHFNFRLTTTNLIGFIKEGGYSLKISSRFGDQFLRYIIADADGFLELKGLGGDKSTEGFEWLLIYLWKIKILKAYRLGLPKTYTTRTDRLNRVKGHLDMNAYLQGSYDGKYLCHYREHSYNNPANQLISETFHKLKGNAFLTDVHRVRQSFLTAVDGKRATRQQLASTAHFTNPYYSDYNTVIDLSKKILRDELSDFGNQSDSSAFLFDVSMLFEYFIRKLLIRHGFVLEDKSSEQLKIPTGSLHAYERKLEPDIVFEHKGRTYIFDVKYKSFDFTYGVKREDLFQLHTYLGQYSNHFDVGGCGVIYPISEDRWEKNNLDQRKSVLHTVMKQGGKDIPFHILFLKVPRESKGESDDSTSFVSKFQENCQRILDSISQKIIC